MYLVISDFEKKHRVELFHQVIIYWDDYYWMLLINCNISIFV